MAVEQTGGLDDLLMGNVAEGSEETSEQIAARISSAQARLAAVRKDEKKSSGDDRHLAQVIKYLTPSLLPFVSWMINHELPSLTILAILSLSSRPAAEVIEKHITLDDVAESAFLSAVSNKAIRGKISEWSALVIAADKESKTTHLEALHSDTEKMKDLAKGIGMILKIYWLRTSSIHDEQELAAIAREFVKKCCAK